jgi:hypothetical protein
VSRLRYNGLSGTLGASLGSDAGDTTITFAAKLTHVGGDVPTIASGAYIPLSLLGSGGKCAEVVHLTSYTAEATTGTVVRGREGSSRIAHDNGATFVNGGLADDTALPYAGINTQSDDYTLVLGDLGKLVYMTKGTATTLTVPTNASVAFPVGQTRIMVAQGGAGQVTIGGASVTFRSSPGLKIAAQYGAAELFKIGTDEWLVVGRLAA